MLDYELSATAMMRLFRFAHNDWNNYVVAPQRYVGMPLFRAIFLPVVRQVKIGTIKWRSIGVSERSIDFLGNPTYVKLF